jgi:membrane protein
VANSPTSQSHHLAAPVGPRSDDFCPACGRGGDEGPHEGDGPVNHANGHAVEPENKPRRPPGGLLGQIAMRTYRHGTDIELMHRSFGFAALGVVTLVPLLIVIAAAAPVGGRTFPQWIVAGLGLSGRSADAVNSLFGPSSSVLSTTTAFSLAVLAVFGLSFVTMVQTGLARVWELPAGRLISSWRRVVWLAVLIGALLAGADVVSVLHGSWALVALRWLVAGLGGTVFFWWSARFLLDGRVPWGALLPGALLTVAGLTGLRLFSALVFSPLIVSSAVTYGAIGSVLIVLSWLIGTGFVIFGAALLGRIAYECAAQWPHGGS